MLKTVLLETMILFWILFIYLFLDSLFFAFCFSVHFYFALENKTYSCSLLFCQNNFVR